MSKSILIGIVAVLAIGGVWWWLGGSQSSPVTNTSAQGRAVFTVTDPGETIQGATSIILTVNKVEVQSASASWVTVSTAVKQYDLLQLKASGTAMLLADINLPVGAYNQVRLGISRVEVTANGITSLAKLPSNTLKIIGNIKITAGGVSTVSLDFVADKSLHLTGNGTYILLPVVRLVTKNSAAVNVDSQGKVTVNGGRTDTDETVGTDETGETKANFELKDTLEVDTDGAIRVTNKTSAPSPSATPAKVSVSIANMSFSAAVITVKKGTRITWTNNDSVSHTVTSDTGSMLNSPTIAPGQSFSFTTTSVGTFAYHCAIHPSMRGSIVVTN